MQTLVSVINVTWRRSNELLFVSSARKGQRPPNDSYRWNVKKLTRRESMKLWLLMIDECQGVFVCRRRVCMYVVFVWNSLETFKVFDVSFKATKAPQRNQTLCNWRLKTSLKQEAKFSEFISLAMLMNFFPSFVLWVSIVANDNKKPSTTHKVIHRN